MSTGSNSSVVGGAGSISGAVSGSNTTLIGGTSSSAFSVAGAGNLAVAGSTGSTTINLTQTGTAGNIIATNPNGGNATLQATLSANGADSVIGGGGASTITAGAGHDVFGFVNGHAGGSEVIIGFNSSDNLAFGGYGYSITNTPSETLTAAGDVIKLSDGTTITLQGYDHKLWS
ncbi:hypothetical protein [Acidisoma silvae]|nr:hypothetical protein [Acidisoma silvae]